MMSLGALLGPIFALSVGGTIDPQLVSHPDVSIRLAQSQAQSTTPTKPAVGLPRPRPADPVPAETALPPETPSQSPKVDSPQWTREQAESERKEESLKRVIQGICRGC